jgi:hypothetical protein
MKIRGIVKNRWRSLTRTGGGLCEGGDGGWGIWRGAGRGIDRIDVEPELLFSIVQSNRYIVLDVVS